MNSKTSPGNTSSGRSRHVRIPRNVVRVAAVMNRDAVKHIGARNTFIVSSARRNSLMIGKSSYFKDSKQYEISPILANQKGGT